MMLPRSLPRLRWLLAAAVAAAIIAAACTANADNEALPVEELTPAATVETPAPAASESSAEPASPTAASTAAPTAQPAEPAQPAAVLPLRAALAPTPRKDLAAGPVPPMLSTPLAKAFYTFPDFAALELAPNLLVAWGLGAPRGEFVVSASIWSANDKAATQLSSAELLSGGALRSDDAIRTVAGATAERAWLEAFGETGAHGVTYDLLLWNGVELVAVVGHFSSAPGNVVAPGAAAQLRDLDGDGDPELVIDRTDPYLFHYTSQIWHADAAVLRRDGDEFREVRLALPGLSVGTEALNESRAVLSFAAAGWWGYALEHAEAAAALAPDNERLAWNIIVIRERGAAALREAARSAVPWLGSLLAGEWGSAVEHLRDIPHRRWLELDRVLRDTPLAGLETEVAQLVEQRADAALSAVDQLQSRHAAPAWLMRGLARWWLDGEMIPTAVDFVEAIPGYWRETIVFDLLWGIGYREG